jgi:hypothetical protein
MSDNEFYKTPNWPSGKTFIALERYKEFRMKACMSAVAGILSIKKRKIRYFKRV